MTMAHKTPANACRIIKSQAYEAFLTLTPIEPVPDTHDVLIQSRLDTAKDPQALQNRHRMMLTTEAVQRLHRYLGDYLEAMGRAD